MAIGNCRKCGRRDEMKGGLCEDCFSAREAEEMQDLIGGRRKLSEEELKKQLEERKKDKSFWWGK